MANKMLIDATHPEETRVVVVRGSRVEEFDFEAASRKPLRGNIYLAKVTRVEPSLQAAFVEYGGNRHGFLAFSEIHPDYYQIPVADRQALLAEEERQQKRDAEAEDEDKPKGRARRPRGGAKNVAADAAGDETVSEAPVDAASEAASEDESGPARRTRKPSADDEGGGVEEVHAEDEVVEQVGSDDALEEVPERAAPRRARTYKIQEVIKRRQIMLVQVVKEERGNKGAALTTYLSLAGRYSVLMPNTARGGGISRKITSAEDRKRLKEVASDLDVPEGMGVILRTAGANRTKAEIKRDFEYLLRLWENVRELTLASSAPSLVYEEGSLIKRSIRDLYNKDIDEVLVAGDDGYREAKDFMRMLMPSHAKNVKPYRDQQPVFARFGVESQLDAMFSPVVQLRSGGYIVINPTEALVSIDVNSGRSTREHNIEDTALKTNLEAAEEVARQLRLRDLAGLIVIDFIDMDEKRNNRAVERKLKDCLKNDRARIQLGRISHFGLMEMSRQRIRTGVLESSTEVCPHCGGTGHVRSSSSVALQLLRAVEDMLLKSNTHNLVVRTRAENALYVLNHKRAHLHELEERFGVIVTVSADQSLTGLIPFAIDKGDLVPNPIPLPRSPEPVHEIADEVLPEDAEDEAAEAEEETETAEPPREAREPREEGRGEGEGGRGEGEGGGRRRRRRRRRRRNGNGEGGPNGQAYAESAEGSDEDGEDEESAGDASADAGAPIAAEVGVETVAEAAQERAPEEAGSAIAVEITESGVTEGAAEAAEPAGEPEAAAEAKPKRRARGGRRGRRGEADATSDSNEAPAADAPAAEGAAEAPAAEAVETVKEAPKPRRRRSTVREPAPVAASETGASAAPEPAAVQPAPEAATGEAASEAPAPEAPDAGTPADNAGTPADAASTEVTPAPEAAAPDATEAPSAATDVSAPVPEDERPRRTGWWSRKLLGN
ncbi:Rne/Rng family ribonuclease [Ancylobacter sp. 6x-1]|uniref:Ribonuclease E n=1 Tax=Ancylobacter crimeensis TaxID=2579147 RepID=A0ABT0D6A3_9HYPH|nr:ribonuclease E/G [Ancylobacter crimeensis]MCK0195475.1 Rne/Rng family ribonuclease [Ancylobacter crimeensis]